MADDMVSGHYRWRMGALPWLSSDAVGI
jgi:hypothetical protein